VEPELILDDVYDHGRLVFRQDWFDSGLSDHAASRPSRSAWGDPESQAGRPDRDLAMHAEIIMHLLSPECDGIPPSAAERGRLARLLTKIRAEIASRTIEF